MHRILFVKDAATMRSLLAFSLEELEQSTKIVEAASGFEALRFLPREDFNLVVRISTCPTSMGIKEVGGLIRAVPEESENAIGAIEAGSSNVMSGERQRINQQGLVEFVTTF